MNLQKQAPFTADARPALNRSVVYRTNGEIHLFYNVKIPDWVILGDNAAYILGLCDGQTSLHAIGKHVQEQGVAMSDDMLLSFIRFANKRGIVEADGLPPIQTLHPKPQPFQSFYLKLTNRCNLECSYCYSSSGPYKSRTELTTDEWIDAINQIREIRPEGGRITFTGGEPMLRKDLVPLAEHAKGLGFSIGLITNGGLINASNCSSIAGLFGSVQISLDGDEAVHDSQRGRGAWTAARRAIDLLKENGANYCVSTVLHRKNKDHLAALVAEFGSKLTVGAMTGFGRAKSKQAGALSDNEYVSSLKLAGVSGHFDDPEFIEHSRRQPRGNCGVGSTTMSLDEDGNVYPCQILIFKEFSAGNIRSRRISDILFSDPWETLTAFSVDSVGEPDARQGCTSCWVRFICGGGCRAKVYSETAQFSGPDGLCELWRSSILSALYKTANLPESKSLFVGD